MTKPTIEEGIIIPPCTQHRKSKWITLFNAMKKGDSILFETPEKALLFRQAIRSKLGNGFLTGRQLKDGYRMWRIL